MTRETVTNIVTGVWQSVLGLTLVPATAAERDGAAGRAMVGEIYITGAWEGAVVARFPLELSLKVAAVMLDVAEPHLTLDDARDCVGELINMIGGSFKATLAGSCQLSLPRVTTEDAPAPAASSELEPSRELERVTLDAEGARLWVTILSGKPRSPRAAS